MAARRILLVNANASEAATVRLAQRAHAYAAEDTELTVVGADHGPEGIDTYLDLAIAGVEVARIVARERDAHDAFVIACGADPGLDAARHVTTKPVVGIAEAGMLCACPLGARFAIVTTLPSDAVQLDELTRRYGLHQRFAGVAAIGMDTAALIAASEDELLERMVAACCTAIEGQRAEVILLGGSVMLGMEQALAERLGVPVLASTACGIKLAEALVALGAHTSRAQKYLPMEKMDALIGYDELQSVYGSVSEARPAS